MAARPVRAIRVPISRISQFSAFGLLDFAIPLLLPAFCVDANRWHVLILTRPHSSSYPFIPCGLAVYVLGMVPHLRWRTESCVAFGRRDPPTPVRCLRLNKP